MTSSVALPSPRASTPRTIAAGTRRALPSTSSAAPAISSATAICVDSSRCPLASVVPRRSRSGTMPATPSASSFRAAGQALDYVRGFNDMAIVIELPVSMLERDPSHPSSFGVWGTTSRARSN